MERLSAWWRDFGMQEHLRTPAMKAMGGALVLVALVSANVSAASRNVSWDVRNGRSAADQAWLDSLVGPISTGPGGAAVTNADPDLAVLPSGGDPSSLVVAEGNAPTAPTAPVNGAPAGSTSVGTPALTAGLLSSGIPVRVLKAYLAAASITTQKDPGCHLPWSLLAGIGRVESNHGRHGGSRVDELGRVSPPIYGPRLDGTSGMALIRDTDGGRLDADTAYDRAVGPMQFLPGTWAGYKADADTDGVAEPQDVDDAALTAAHYLCAGNGDLATQAGRWNAVLRYNHSVSYAAEVLSLADSYATGKVIAATAPPAGVTVPAPSAGPQGTPPAKSGTTTLAPEVVPQVQQPTVPALPAAPAVPPATPVTPAPDATDPATTTPPAPPAPTTAAATPATTATATVQPSTSATVEGTVAATPSPSGSPSGDPSASSGASASASGSPSTGASPQGPTGVTATPVGPSGDASPSAAPSPAAATSAPSGSASFAPSAAATGVVTAPTSVAATTPPSSVAAPAPTSAAATTSAGTLTPPVEPAVAPTTASAASAAASSAVTSAAASSSPSGS